MFEKVDKIGKISDADFRFTGRGRPCISGFGTRASSVADARVRQIAHFGKFISVFRLRVSVFGGNMFPTIGNE